MSELYQPESIQYTGEEDQIDELMNFITECVNGLSVDDWRQCSLDKTDIKT